MPWLVLIISGLFEAVWAGALDKMDGQFRTLPFLVFLASLTVSMGGLAWALKEIPLGTGYAVWVGTGALATIAWAVFTGAETMSVVKALLLATLVGSIIGLRLIEN